MKDKLSDLCVLKYYELLINLCSAHKKMATLRLSCSQITSKPALINSSCIDSSVHSIQRNVLHDWAISEGLGSRQRRTWLKSFRVQERRPRRLGMRLYFRVSFIFADDFAYPGLEGQSILWREAIRTQVRKDSRTFDADCSSVFGCKTESKSFGEIRPRKIKGCSRSERKQWRHEI